MKQIAASKPRQVTQPDLVATGLASCKGFRIEAWMEKCVELLRLYHHDSFLSFVRIPSLTRSTAILRCGMRLFSYHFVSAA